MTISARLSNFMFSSFHNRQFLMFYIRKVWPTMQKLRCIWKSFRALILNIVKSIHRESTGPHIGHCNYLNGLARSKIEETSLLRAWNSEMLFFMMVHIFIVYFEKEDSFFNEIALWKGQLLHEFCPFKYCIEYINTLPTCLTVKLIRNILYKWIQLWLLTPSTSVKAMILLCILIR